MTTKAWLNGVGLLGALLSATGCGGHLDLGDDGRGTTAGGSGLDAGSGGSKNDSTNNELVGGTGGSKNDSMNDEQVGGADSTGSCTVGLIHVALGTEVANSDFDYTSRCASDSDATHLDPFAYFVGSALVLSACASSEPGSPRLRIVASDVTGAGHYSTNSVSLTDRNRRLWAYEGSAPSTQLGWTTKVDELSAVDEAVSGTYAGQLTSASDVANLMGTFSLCRGPDREDSP
jgi:hypothetical protein